VRRDLDDHRQPEHFAIDDADVGRRAVRGGAITVVAQFARGLFEAAGSVFLARALAPADFGLIGMIVSVTGVIDLLKDFGLSSATIQRQRIDHEQVNVLFWINVGIGLALTCVTAALAPALALGYARPELLQLTLALSLGTFIGSLSIQHHALLRRRLELGRVASIDLVSTVVATVLAVWGAYVGWGVWALVARQLVRLACQTLLTWLLSSWRPSRPRAADVRDLLRFGTHVSGFQLLNYCERNLDNVLVGRFAGAQALGFYTRAYELMRMPLNQVNAPVAAVAVPALSRLASDPERYRRAYRSLARLLALLTVPLCPLFVLAADWFFPTVLGPQWTGSIRIFQWLALSLLVKPLMFTTSWLLVSQGRSAELLRWGVIATTIAIASFVVGLPWGALGVAIAYTVADLLLRAPWLLWWVGRSGPVGVRDLVGCLGPAWVCAACVALSYLALDHALVGLGLGASARVASCVPSSLIAGYAVVAATPWGRAVIADGVDVWRTLRGGR
jgi:O-antigen/teichoic acid export membrane protein